MGLYLDGLYSMAKEILFLDIDGVLSTQKQKQEGWEKWATKSFEGRPEKDFFCRMACARLQDLLIERPELYLVLSSDWRLTHSLQEMANWIGIPVDRFVGKCSLTHWPRHLLISDWLLHNDTSDVMAFAIVDDSLDIKLNRLMMSHWIPIDPEEGLTDEDIRLLNNVLDFPDNRWKDIKIKGLL